MKRLPSKGGGSIGESSICLLGLNYKGHDASASLIVDGEVVFSASEERFNREKKTRSFPEHAIEACLTYIGISVNRLNGIAYYMQPEELYEQRVKHYLGRYYPKCLPIFDATLNAALDMRNVEQEVRGFLDYEGPFHYVRHHDAHFASCFHTSPFEEAALLSVDGVGEINSAVLGYGEGTEFSRIKDIDYPHSLGLVYAGVTYYLGFSCLGHEGKVMALASFGDPDRHISRFREIIQLQEDGGLELDLDYFAFPFMRDRWISDEFVSAFGPRRQTAEPLTQHHHDVAAALQKRTEEVMFHFAESLKETTKSKNLCLVGGVVLNSVANGKLVKMGLFRDYFVIPASGDDGTSIGAALYVYHNILNHPDRRRFTSPYLGPEYSREEILEVLQGSEDEIAFEESADIAKRSAALIAEGKIVGWFQGRMEIGPRALGNRSILADPRRPDMKDVLNLKVKHREGFRPFAPSVLAGHQREWFDCDYPADYMLYVYDVLEDKRGQVPSITHVDGTGRLQSVREDLSPRFYQLIEAFHGLTGVPMVVNTSFNVQGEPIVCTPQDAVDCFLATEVDCLSIGDFVVRKKNIAP